MVHKPAMPELTDERRERLIKWYEDYVDKAIAKLEGWYPDKVYSSTRRPIWSERFFEDFGKAAEEIGYEGWKQLAAAYGFDCGVGAVEKIDIRSNADRIPNRAWKNFGEYFEINRLYPDGVIVDFRKRHNYFCSRASVCAKKLGFPTWKELLIAAGFDVRDSVRERKPSQDLPPDFDDILSELADRYAGNPARNVKQIVSESNDPRLLPLLDSSVAGKVKSRYGVTLNKLLSQKGILGTTVPISDEELLNAVKLLEEKYSASDSKPKTIAKLLAENPDLKPQIKRLSSSSVSNRLLGGPVGQYLVSKGVLAKEAAKKARVTRSAYEAEACEAIVEGLKAKYAHAVRPRNLKELTEQNEDYALHATEIHKWAKTVFGQSAADFVKAQQLISPVGRPDSLPRPGDEEIQAFYEEIQLGNALATIDGLPDEDVVRFESNVTGSEDYDNAKNYEMLRIGDYIAFELVEGTYGGWYARANFCGHALGLINYQDGLDYGIASKLLDAEAGLLIGDRVYAKVTGIAGGQKKPRAELEVFYGKNTEGVNLINDVLLSRDGKKALSYTSDGDVLDIPEGVEVIPPYAFQKLAVSKVKFPSTLREIGERAFSLCSCREYRIPASVEKIGDGAFSFCFKSVLLEEDRFYRCTARGPVRIDVDADNERYYSAGGSLIARDGDKRRLVSLYYDGAPKRPYEPWAVDGRKLNAAVPDGVTSLAPYCVSAADGYSLNVLLPDSLETIEKRAFVTEHETGYTRLHISSINIPAGLVDVSLDFWGNCAEDIPYGLSEDDATGMELYHCKVKLDPANPRYALKGHMFYDKALLGAYPERPIPEIARPYCAARESACLDAWPLVDYCAECESVKKGNLLFVEFEAEIDSVPQELIDGAKDRDNPDALRYASVFGLRHNDGEVFAAEEEGQSRLLDVGPIAYFGETRVGEVAYGASDNPFAKHPMLNSAPASAGESAGEPEEDAERFSFTDPETGITTNYCFWFDSDDPHSEVEYISELVVEGRVPVFSGDDAVEVALGRWCSERGHSGDKVSASAPENRPSLNDVVRDYGRLGGIGEPLAVYACECVDPAHLETDMTVEVRIRMAFDLRGARREG
ncbi:leucine-rich repeat domain-containing protein [Paratractidigestivibacter sp.]|uniref:leucine-rich repeat domain-containing protein n=2 Tax=Paratractidigestivibacter sp. TaxID=2847316 RepID=UPI002ABDC76C|nr:leucine-rich repeat domain-containing protein [Paratractidigestivibacter sp.]